MQDRALKYCLYVLAVSIIGIGLSNFVAGAYWTATQLGSVFQKFGISGSVLDLAAPNADSELRFYAVLWVAFGLTLIQVTRNLGAYYNFVPYYLGVIFFGGIGRVISVAVHGPPHPLFELLMWIELSIPIILLLLWFRMPTIPTTHP